MVLANNGVFTDNIFPVKLLEFVQMRIPVIATKTNTLRKYFSDEQIFFLNKNSPDEFAKAVLTLYKNNNLRIRYTNNALKYLRVCNWKKEEIKYHKIVTFLVKQG